MSNEPKEPQDVANEYLRKHHITELFEVFSPFNRHFNKIHSGSLHCHLL